MPDELSIRTGDVITAVRQMEGGWWEGTSKGKRGLFPDNFVKVRQKYRDRLKGLYVVARNFFLLLLNFSAWPCLAVA